jgi:hypothetical protein
MRRSLTFGPIQSSVPPKEFFFALVFTFAALAIPVSAQTVAFTNVNVIPMDRERVVANQTVVIKNGLIVEIGDAKKVKLRVMVANGVTTVRFMIGTPKNTKTDKSHPRQWVDTFRSFLQSASRQRDIA